MAGTTLESVECLFETEVSVIWGNRAPWWRSTDVIFPRWKAALTERLFDVTRFGYTLFLCGYGDEEA